MWDEVEQSSWLCPLFLPECHLQNAGKASRVWAPKNALELAPVCGGRVVCGALSPA